MAHPPFTPCVRSCRTRLYRGTPPWWRSTRTTPVYRSDRPGSRLRGASPPQAEPTLTGRPDQTWRRPFSCQREVVAPPATHIGRDARRTPVDGQPGRWRPWRQSFVGAPTEMVLVAVRFASLQASSPTPANSAHVSLIWRGRLGLGCPSSMVASERDER
jgi:hypothetical protein